MRPERPLKKAKEEPLCPSAQPEMANSVVFGIVGGTATEPRVGYLVEPQPTTAEMLELAKPAEPTEVFRFAAPCAGHSCRHYDGSRCRLASRTVQQLGTVVDSLPPCRIRPQCRWWLQEGKSACLRCPQITTKDYAPSEAGRVAADPDG